MSRTWHSEEPALDVSPGPAGWFRVLRRGVPIALVLSGGLALMLLLRLGERPLFGLRRPVTPYVTVAVCRSVLWLMGLKWRCHGRTMKEGGALVANHCSWIDICALNAADRICFVAKAEVAGWPVIGWLARATGTVFIRRRRHEARAHNRVLEKRLKAGHRLLFFPEGTSTDGLRVLPFKPTLFQAFLSPELRRELWIQPVSVIYRAPAGEDPRFYGWWGDMEFGSHMLHVLAAQRQGRVDVVFHAPLQVRDFPDRKALAAACEQAVRAGFAQYAPAVSGIPADSTV